MTLRAGIGRKTASLTSWGLYVISYADTARGKRIDVFYDMGSADTDKEFFVFRSLNFDFDKYAITPDMLPPWSSP